MKKGKMGTGTKKVEDRKGNHEEKTRYRKAMEGKTRREAPPTCGSRPGGVKKECTHRVR